MVTNALKLIMKCYNRVYVNVFCFHFKKFQRNWKQSVSRKTVRNSRSGWKASTTTYTGLQLAQPPSQRELQSGPRSWTMFEMSIHTRILFTLSASMWSARQLTRINGSKQVFSFVSTYRITVNRHSYLVTFRNWPEIIVVLFSNMILSYCLQIL